MYIGKKISSVVLISLVLSLNVKGSVGATGFFRGLFSKNSSGASSNDSLNSRILSSSFKVGNISVGSDENKNQKLCLLDNLKAGLEDNLDIKSSTFGSLLKLEPDYFWRNENGDRVYGYSGYGIKVKVKTNDNGVVTSTSIKTDSLKYKKDFLTNMGSIKENKSGLSGGFKSSGH